jgi:predicted MFS family arabinose efflux permease
MKDCKNHTNLWLISGIGGIFIRDCFNIFTRIIGISKHTIWEIAADIFVQASELKTFLGIIIGLLADTIIGGMLGIVIGLIIDWKGKKGYIIDGLGVGIFTWLVFFGVLLHNLPETIEKAPKDSLSNFLAFIGHAIFGLVTAWVYVHLLSFKEKRLKRAEKI